MGFITQTIGTIPKLLTATPVVLELLFGAFAIALVLGLLIALIQVNGPLPLRWICVVFVEIMRGTPLLVQLVWIFFVLPTVGIQLSSVTAGVTGLGLNYAAYMSEVFRSSILSVPSGQTEAALSLGYTDRQALWRIVVPQSLPVAIPPIGNYFVAMIKDTSLTSVIAVTEILKTANIIGSTTFQVTQAYTAAALIYLVISLPLSWLLKVLERRTRRHA